MAPDEISKQAEDTGDDDGVRAIYEEDAPGVQHTLERYTFRVHRTGGMFSRCPVYMGQSFKICAAQHRFSGIGLNRQLLTLKDRAAEE